MPVNARCSVLGDLVRFCGVITTKPSGSGSRSLAMRVLGVVVVALLALSAGVARAEPPKLVSYGTFPSNAPSPVGVAVDQSTGDVYVAGLVGKGENERPIPSNVAKFDASGRLLSPPSPFGEAFNSGAAVSPTNGDVYVLAETEIPAGPTAIDVYDPNSGALLSSFSVPRSNNFFGSFTVAQIAADSAGNVYVPVVSENEVLEYNPTTCPAPPGLCTPLKTFTGSGSSALKEPTGVTVDSSGNVWVADHGNNRIEELSPAILPIGKIESEGVQAVALGGHGDVFAVVENSADSCEGVEPPCPHLVEYSSAGVQLADIGAGKIGAAASRLPSMVAVNGASGRVYVSDGANNRVWIFGPPLAPVLGRELVAEVGTSEAKLGALVNPGGLETSYRFEFGTTSAYGQTTPLPEGNVGQGVTPRTVWASAEGLAPGTTYHYRVIVSSELGTVVGADQTFTTELSEEASCPNEQFRSGFSASLPDCRAYELVTPPTKASTQPDPEAWPDSAKNNRTALEGPMEGNRMAYRAIDSLPGSQSDGDNYLSTRGTSGWSTENEIPLQSYTAFQCPRFGVAIPAYSTDLSRAVMGDGGNGRYNNQLQGGCGAESFELVSGEPQGVENLLLRDNTNNGFQLINVTPQEVTPADAKFDGGSPDLSHVVFEEHAQLTANAPPGADDLYEWTGGVVRLVTVLPNGGPVVGSLASNGETHEHAVSADGSHILFTANGNLYLRLNGSSTVQVDASQGGSGNGGGHFMDASADGSQVLFTDENQLTAGASAAPGEPDLYEYAVSTGQLTDISVATSGHADVHGVIGISRDGSYVYFVALGSLATGATEGQPNLYLRHGGTTTFTATLALGDEGGSGPVLNGGARVSPDGAFLAFNSEKSLTGYNNIDANTGGSDREIFLYSAASGQLACASCIPSGEAPVSGAEMRVFNNQGGPHYLSDSGRLFFETADALLPRDTNGTTDVYEYEGGQVRLISSGTSSSEARILDASESGNDVFFLTRQKLVPQETEEEARAIYDARVGGGFPAPSGPPPCTTADACRTPVSPQPSLYGAPSSATFSGAGNLAPPSKASPKRKAKPKRCKKGLVKRKGKCVKAKRGKKAKKSNRGTRG